MRRQALHGQHVERGQQLRRVPLAAGDQQVEECLDGFAERLGLLVAVGDHEQRALGHLPQQHRVERLGGGGEPGERRRGRLRRAQALQQFLKRRMAAQSRKQIANGRMNQGISGARIFSTIPVVE